MTDTSKNYIPTYLLTYLCDTVTVVPVVTEETIEVTFVTTDFFFKSSIQEILNILTDTNSITIAMRREKLNGGSKYFFSFFFSFFLRTNERPGTGHVTSGPIRGLKQKCTRWHRHTDNQTNMATV